MYYTIKAIPTKYAGVNFRSRLEARWAAFFDLCGWRWDYEPFDLEGWAPDFRVTIAGFDVLTEVKPTTDSADIELYDKVTKTQRNYPILLLGVCPTETTGRLWHFPEAENWFDIYGAIHIDDYETVWREAGNLVQWKRKSA